MSNPKITYYKLSDEPLPTLSLQEFNKFPAWYIFSRGKTIINGAHSYFIAIKSKWGADDWAIYYSDRYVPTLPETPENRDLWEEIFLNIAKWGVKLRDEQRIRELANVSDEVLKLYRY